MPFFHAFVKNRINFKMNLEKVFFNPKPKFWRVDIFLHFDHEST